MIADKTAEKLHLCSAKVLELCMQNRNPEVNVDDLKDQVISISGCRSFAFSFADALELHGT